LGKAVSGREKRGGGTKNIPRRLRKGATSDRVREKGGSQKGFKAIQREGKREKKIFAAGVTMKEEAKG